MHLIQVIQYSVEQRGDIRMTVFVVLTTTSQNQPFVEIVTDKLCVAELYQKINIDKGLFTIVVEKELNLKPVMR